MSDGETTPVERPEVFEMVSMRSETTHNPTGMVLSMSMI